MAKNPLYHRSYLLISEQNPLQISWITSIIEIKRVPAGTPVGYNRSFVTERETALAILPIGYWDGYPRSLSNTGAQVLIEGILCPVVGIISMNLTTIDITECPSASINTPVVLIGSKPEISLAQLAQRAKVTPQELFATLNSEIPRISTA